MNKYEYKKVLKEFKINNQINIAFKASGQEQVYYWNDCSINYGGNIFVEIKGKIPYEVAERIYQRYPNNEYGIRIDGGSSKWTPEMRAIDFEFEQETKNLKCTEDLKEKMDLAYLKLKKRPKENKYIPSYQIDTIQGLIIFLSELDNYYRRKKKENEIDESEEKKKLARIYTDIINDIRPNISNRDWLKRNPENYSLYLKTRNQNANTTFGEMYFETIDDFDKAVNPFMNIDICLNNPEDYLDRIEISGYKYDEKDCPNCCELTIKDKETGNTTRYSRDKDGFSYTLEYQISEENNSLMCHYFSNKIPDNEDSGEVIYIWNHGKDCQDPLDIKYNLTKKVIGVSEEKKKKNELDKNEEQRIDIYVSLLKGVNMAKMVTIENMQHKEKVKVLSRNESNIPRH